MKVVLLEHFRIDTKLLRFNDKNKLFFLLEHFRIDTKVKADTLCSTFFVSRTKSSEHGIVTVAELVNFGRIDRLACQRIHLKVKKIFLSNRIS